jgi:hypothetical protein
MGSNRAADVTCGSGILGLANCRQTLDGTASSMSLVHSDVRIDPRRAEATRKRRFPRQFSCAGIISISETMNFTAQ